ncbi:MAG: hypothetical protein JO022_22095, partial [Acidobacteriaceae bacterium]|nr:hypothetical protein [Acidobacteriaceae bacterium]
MRFRILLLSVLLVGGFAYVTSKSGWSHKRLLQPLTSRGLPLWSGPRVAKSASLGTDELNNIDVYKTAHLATVNI